MSARTDALYRVIGLVYLSTIGWIVLALSSIAAILWMGIDVVGQILTGGEFMPAQSSRTTRFLKRIWNWGRGQVEYVFFGTGSFPFLP